MDLLLPHLICLGLSYKTAPVETRERVALAAEGLQELRHISELVVLSTCNRVELYAVGDSEAAFQSLSEALNIFENSSAAFYCYRDRDCVRHLFEVAAGLDSQVLGEPQILGQIADAYQGNSQSLGTVLATLMQAAIHTGKR